MRSAPRIGKHWKAQDGDTAYDRITMHVITYRNGLWKCPTCGYQGRFMTRTLAIDDHRRAYRGEK